MSPLLSRTSESVASGRMLTCSSSITLSTSTRMSRSFSGLKRKRVHRESRAGLSLWE